MTNNMIHVKTLLDIIFKTKKKRAYILAHGYLIKNESIISRWRSGRAIPSDDDILKIIEFTLDGLTITQEKIIRTQIENIIVDSAIRQDIKEALLGTSSFGDFLKEAINVAITMNNSTNNLIQYDEQKKKSKNNVYSVDLEFLNENGQSAPIEDLIGKPFLDFKGTINLIQNKKLLKFSRLLNKKSAIGITMLLFIVMFSSFLLNRTNSMQNPTIQKEWRGAVLKDSTSTPTPKLLGEISTTYTPVQNTNTPPPQTIEPSAVIKPTQETTIVEKAETTNKTDIDITVHNKTININGSNNNINLGSNSIIIADDE